MLPSGERTGLPHLSYLDEHCNVLILPGSTLISSGHASKTESLVPRVPIQRKIAFSNLQALECLGICSSASSHPFFSWSFLLHQPVVAASSQQPYLAAVGICLCLNLWIFK